MKRKRLLLIVGCLVAILLAGYGTLRLTAPRHRITWETVQAIQKGMTEEDIKAFLGVEAGDYSSKKYGGKFYEIPGGKFPGTTPGIKGYDLVKEWGGKFWVSDEAAVWVRFDEAGRVTESLRGSVPEDGDESFLTKLRRWLGM